MKTKLTKFVVTSGVKRHQKAGFLSPRSSKITVTKEKDMRKRKSGEKERRRREKSNGCTIIVFVIATLILFLAEKDCWTQKGLFGDKVFKNPTRKKQENK